MATMAAAGALEDHHHSRMMEEKKLEYFASINPMAKKIMQEREKIRQKHGPAWEQMSPLEQDTAIDNCLMEPHIRARYAMHRVERPEVLCYPKLLLQTGQKIVHFGDEDITWQDEHSAPFSWETKSQLDFSLSLGTAEQGANSSQSDAKSTKSTGAGSQLAKNTSSAKGGVSEGPGLGLGLGLGRRTEEESSFWKLSAERSRMEGERPDYHLTPSQIKSMEKGEKPLPSYLRQETSPVPRELPEAPDPSPAPPPPAPTKSIKQRAPRPPAPPPPVPVAVPVPATAVAPPPAVISVAPPAPPRGGAGGGASSGWERSQSTLPSVSTALDDDVFSMSASSRDHQGGSPNQGGSPKLATSPTFSQFNTSNNLLKTGFDFLDNW